MKNNIDYNSAEGMELLSYVDKLTASYAIPIHDCSFRKVSFKQCSPEKQIIVQKQRTQLPALSNLTIQFAKRYNANELSGYFKYEDYLKDIEIQELITAFELDKDKFWLLILFIYDFSESLCISGIDFSPSPNEQLQQLVDAVNSCVIDFNQDNGTTMNKKVKLEIHIEGIKKTIIINAPSAIHFIADSCERRMEDDNTWNIPFMNYQQPLEESKTFKFSPYIYFFATMVLNFFNKQPKIRSQRKKGAKHSLKEMELVSRLIYLTRLSKNEAWLEIENDYLKGYLKQYKDLDFTYRSSSVYDSFLI